MFFLGGTKVCGLTAPWGTTKISSRVRSISSDKVNSNLKGTAVLNAKLTTLLVASILTLCGGCAFTPAPVILAEKPSGPEVPKNGLRVAVVVRDVRPDLVKAAHLCGTKRNSYMIPTSVAFLAHPEPYDVLLAYHIKHILERAGYQVVAALPAVPETLNTAYLSKDNIKPSNDTSSTLRDEPPPSDVKEGGSVRVAELGTDDDQAPPSWSSLKQLKDVDAIIDIKVDSLNSDCIQGVVAVTTVGWCKSKVAICDPSQTARTVVWGKSYAGFGTSGPQVVITDVCYTTAIDMAYWIMLHEFEKQARSDEFRNAVKTAKGQSK